jgi:hypothetical protein
VAQLSQRAIASSTLSAEGKDLARLIGAGAFLYGLSQIGEALGS